MLLSSNSNSLFGLVLLVGATVIGAHAWDINNFAKTNTTPINYLQTTPSIVPIPRARPLPVVDTAMKISVAAKKYTGHPISAKKKARLRKSIFTKMEGTHVYKFIVTHGSKSKLHKHHHHHHSHHGHGHAHGKISGHGAPPHLTGPPGHAK